ncbi:MAG: cysteine--tRNA ligase, partial [Myxococcales bacterium]
MNGTLPIRHDRAMRYELPPASGPTAADLVLAGAPLPLTGTLRVYTCGITPYDVTHLGHASTFVWADLLTHLARLVDVKTVSSRNVTDIDDVLTAAAEVRQRHYDELAVTAEFDFERDLAALNVARPDLTPRVRSHVPQVIQVCSSLLALGRAYEVDGTVYFAAPDDLDTAGLSETDARAAFAEFGDTGSDARRQWCDVPLWKSSGEGDPAWPSPWGWGRPAWHVGCTAMATTVFGASVDVLVGGADLAFPHHAYQTAIAEAVTGVSPFARRAMHVGTVHHGGAKMAKSTGNLVLVRDLLESHPGEVLRLHLLNRAWGDDWEFDAGQLSGTADDLLALRQAAGSPATGGVGDVLAALLDDLDVPRA